MTDEPTKPFGKFRVPVNCVDRTAERSGKPVAIIGGIAPSQVRPQQDGDRPEPQSRTPSAC
jgi:hypothetical protein